MRKKAFTLIELIAVLVILAILALIVTPLVMNIIKKARVAADRRSIDAYGRSVELAITTYLLDNGDFPTSINDLTIEYSGDQVVCSTTQLNGDSSVYLSGCSVSGRNLDYTYGIDKSPTYESYIIGDEVSYNGVNYYVLENSGVKKSTVKILKADVLTKAEIDSLNTEYAKCASTYYTDARLYVACDNNSVAYYHSSSCYTSDHSGSSTSGCFSDYDYSDIKKVVDAWASVNFNADDIVDIRLINKSEVEELANSNFIYLNNISYWTMSKDEEYESWIYVVGSNGLTTSGVYYNYAVRPVVTIKKSALN